MITPSTARALREAGLAWQPAEGDHFTVPGSDFGDNVLIISSLPAVIHRLQEGPVAAFYGSAEWALDHVLLSEALWLPHEHQLRAELEARIDANAPLLLERVDNGYRCETEINGAVRGFSANNAAEAYAAALLAILP